MIPLVHNDAIAVANAIVVASFFFRRHFVLSVSVKKSVTFFLAHVHKQSWLLLPVGDVFCVAKENALA